MNPKNPPQFPRERGEDLVPSPLQLLYTEVGFTPLNPPKYRGETKHPVPSPFQGEG
jgi:hypothetical protein